jgi:betaine-homocysteine S-methyltransferase
MALDIRYLGVCCGAGPHHIRALAEAVGKKPPASKYSPDMSKHAFLGSHAGIKKVQKDYADKL